MAGYQRAMVDDDLPMRRSADEAPSEESFEPEALLPLVSGVVARRATQRRAGSTMPAPSHPGEIASKLDTQRSEAEVEPFASAPTMLSAARLEIIEIPPLPSVKGFAEVLGIDCDEEPESVLQWVDAQLERR